MASYRKILLATDFSEFSGQLEGRALEITIGFGAELSVVHVLEPLPMLDPGYAEILPLELDLTEQMLKASKARLEKLADHLNIAKERQWLEVGSPKVEIVRVAAEQSIDLIVIGTHGHHGLGVLLGSTATSVVNHADCDVLTVRLRGAET